MPHPDVIRSQASGYTFPTTPGVTKVTIKKSRRPQIQIEALFFKKMEFNHDPRLPHRDAIRTAAIWPASSSIPIARLKAPMLSFRRP
jgi:hypothetical protein